mmetsp:Transcript_31689/g.75573  ORF Transcript_31689/g.75573 Transcript_31689/m.75573 type:complete len:662 (-) Transcript_31689:42-2027(-)|eukprot:CAMPEP_0181439300 /NCGR_PEP_ID=MMETSP1110-20121109/22354_1 /TAXON_ID=174948 /ORGANISM="Symbiodinium sp., Strain CCMP421" /LENGTH=661 /DNA_ID=CAMNT_0023563015 /DNA_START=54 /DNA_END=2039 /DNA_ORIENTATION=-
MVRWLPWALAATSRGVAVRVSKHPVALVTDLLQQLQGKVEKQGEDEATLWDQLQCNCRDTAKSLQQSIEEEQSRLPMLRSEITGLVAQKARLLAEKERAATDLTEAREALTSSAQLRKKEAAAYAKAKAETAQNLEAIGQAIGALEKGLAGSFLQSQSADLVRQAVASANLRDSDRDALSRVFSGETLPESSSAVVGMLQSMRDAMEEEQGASEAKETEAKEAFEGMATAKRSQVATLAAELEAKITRIGEMSVDMVNKQEAIDDSSKKLQEDTKLLADSKETCQQQEQDWQLRTETRNEELQAIQETLKILTEEAAGVLQTAPSFLQVASGEQGSSLLAAAAGMLEGSASPSVALLAMALRSGKIDFKKVQDRVSDMIEVLKREQHGEDEKLSWCKAEKRGSEGNLQTLEQAAQDLGKILDEVKADKEQAEQEVAGLTKSIQDLDEQMDKNTQQRQKENAEYKEALATNDRASALLERAKERLRRFYESKAPKASLLARRRLLERVRAATRTIAGFEVAHESSQAADPQGFGSYQKQSGHVVIEMLDRIVKDLAADQKALEKQEKDAQASYVRSSKDAQEARQVATRSLAEQSGVRAGLAKRLQGIEMKKQTNADGQANMKQYLLALMGDCEILKSHEGSKEARQTQISRLESAKALLAR